jgi:hypothetical protein
MSSGQTCYQYRPPQAVEEAGRPSRYEVPLEKAATTHDASWRLFLVRDLRVSIKLQARTSTIRA